MTNVSNLFPALNGFVVTEAHRKECLARGHATHKVNGKVSPVCPRCGEKRPVVQTYTAAKLSKTMARELLLATVQGGVVATKTGLPTYRALAKRGLLTLTKATAGWYRVEINDDGLNAACELESAKDELHVRV